MFETLSSGLLSLIAFVAVISFVVVIHELGHFWVGRRFGVHAEVFSIGFGPTLVSWTDKKGTDWRIAALPLGGYVRFLGDENAASASDALASLPSPAASAGQSRAVAAATRPRRRPQRTGAIAALSVGSR